VYRLGSDAPEGFKTPYVLVLLVAGFSLIVGFIVWENFFKYPLMPLGVWRDPTLCIVSTDPGCRLRIRDINAEIQHSLS
jgi:hypothetical protein